MYKKLFLIAVVILLFLGLYVFDWVGPKNRTIVIVAFVVGMLPLYFLVSIREKRKKRKEAKMEKSKQEL
ncbi:hypothetical protein GCM10022378_08220 [Salinicoccus jeotgali]|uniref:Uncharacterized protein n=1 Tax=Salinicoccus jeotgali TaxID=381634 RepID=A0ABP7ELC0_9STAP